MAIYEGAMLGGYLVPHEDFVKLMTEYLSINSAQIKLYLEATLNCIEDKDTKGAYQAWDKFQQEILKNPETSLLAILNYSAKADSGKQTWTFIQNEENAIANKSGILNIQSVGDELKKSYASYVLARHLSKLHGELNELTSTEERRYYYQTYKGQEEKKYIQKLNHIVTYRQIIYGGMKGQYFNGKVADAFVNHLGGVHPDIFTKNGLFNSDLSDDRTLAGLEHLDTDKGVRQEELSTGGSLSFIRLLVAAMNNIGWYTGGDLILTDATGKIIANIQLKTSRGTGETIGAVRTAALKTTITNILLEFDKDLTATAEKFYNALATSAQISDAEHFVEEDIYELARKTLLQGLT